MSDEIKVQSKNKRTKLLIAIVAVVIAMLTVVAIVMVSSNSSTAKKVKEQLSLGDKYLSEIQYEQAIAAYELAIEIDPKCEEAYLGLAEVYMAIGDLDKAKDILDEAEDALGKETEGIEALRDKIEQNEEKASTNVQEPTGSAVQTQDGTPTPTESVAQPPNGTPMPDAPKMVNGVFKLQTTSDGAEAEAEYFKVTQNDTTGEIKIALSGVSIQDSYVTNKSTSGENYLEYGWHVKAVAENYKYEVSVSSWASNPGQEMSRKVSEMQHSIWEFSTEEESWKSIGKAEVEYTAESITWIFTMPEGYTLDVREIKEYEIGITEDCDTTEIRRYTPSTEGTMTSTPALKPSPTLQPTAPPTPSPTSTPMPAEELTDYVIDWKDENLEKAMREITGIYNRDIMYSDVAEYTTLNISDYGIRNISALSNLKNLTDLDLDNNEISDISALGNLTNLTRLRLGFNEISDISVLVNLTSIRMLELHKNKINDVSALSGLDKLSFLNLGQNEISDISALGGLVNLRMLALGRNKISDVSALSGLVNLTYLYLDQNEISDISALTELANLTEVSLASNYISDYSPVAHVANVYE